MRFDLHVTEVQLRRTAMAVEVNHACRIGLLEDIKSYRGFLDIIPSTIERSFKEFSLAFNRPRRRLLPTYVLINRRAQASTYAQLPGLPSLCQGFVVHIYQQGLDMESEPPEALWIFILRSVES